MNPIQTAQLQTLNIDALQLVKLREQGGERRLLLFENWEAKGENEMVLFLKPEVMALSQASLALVLGLVFKSIKNFGLAPEAVIYLSAEYLKRYALIDEHYGVINQLAKAAKSSLSEEAKRTFEKVYGRDVRSAPLLGGFEFLDRFEGIGPEELDELWSSERSEKLASGTYCRHLSFRGEEVFLINGFHPMQLMHYTAPGRGILVIALRGDTNWREARNSMVGATRPEDAISGSLRAELLSRKNALGLEEVSQAFNGVHLSAGPVEGLTELRRFVSDLSGNQELRPAGSFYFGARLIENFGEENTRFLLTNPVVELEGQPQSIFELTEEADSSVAIERLSCISSLTQSVERR